MNLQNLKDRKGENQKSEWPRESEEHLVIIPNIMPMENENTW